LTVIPDGNRYKIIDGQHRFCAVKSLLMSKNIKSFKLHLRIIDEKKMEVYKIMFSYLVTKMLKKIEVS